MTRKLIPGLIVLLGLATPSLSAREVTDVYVDVGGPPVAYDLPEEELSEGRNEALCPLTVSVHSSSIAHLLIASYRTRKSLSFDRTAWSYHDAEIDKVQRATYSPDSEFLPK